MNRHPVTLSRDGTEVYVDLISSPAASQISQQPYLLPLVREIVVSLKLTGKIVQMERDMGRIIGTTDVVATSDKDAVLYAKPLKSATFVRFVKNRPLAPTSYLAVELRKAEEGGYQLWSVRFGRTVPELPGEADDAESRQFWDTHAVIWGNRPVQAQTISKDCPWPA